MKNSILMVLVLFMTTWLQARETKIIAFYTKNVARVSDKDVRLAINNILREAQRVDNINIKEEFPSTVSAVIDGFINKKYALITINTYDVMKNYTRLRPHIEKIWSIAIHKQRPKTAYYILVRKGASFDEKKHFLKKFHAGYLRFDAMQNVFLNKFILENFHVSSKDFFQKITPFSSSSEVILKLFFGNLDVGVVSEDAYNVAVELNPQLKTQLKIIAKTKAIFPDIGLTFSYKGDTQIAKLYDAFTHETSKIKNLSNMLMLYKAEAIMEFSLKDLDAVHQFYQTTLDMESQYESKTTP